MGFDTYKMTKMKWYMLLNNTCFKHVEQWHTYLFLIPPPHSYLMYPCVLVYGHYFNFFNIHPYTLYLIHEQDIPTQCSEQLLRILILGSCDRSGTLWKINLHNEWTVHVAYEFMSVCHLHKPRSLEHFMLCAPFL